MGLLDQELDFAVNYLREVVAIVNLFVDLPSEEHHLFALAEGAWTKFLAHSQLSDHGSGNLRGLL